MGSVYPISLLPFSVSPVVFDSFFKQGKRNVVCGSSGATQFLDHPHCAVRISRMDENSRGCLKFRMSSEPASYRVASAFIVPTGRVVVFRVKIVIQKDGVIRICTQEFLSLLYVMSHVNKIAFKTSRKPPVSPLVVVQEKNFNWMALGLYFAESKLAQQ